MTLLNPRGIEEIRDILHMVASVKGADTHLLALQILDKPSVTTRLDG